MGNEMQNKVQNNTKKINELSENNTIEAIIVRRLNLNAGITDWVSHSIDNIPSGKVTFNDENNVELR